MDNELDHNALIGHVRNLPIMWITFETNDKGHLHIRTLTGHRVIEDVEKAREILGILNEIASVDSYPNSLPAGNREKRT